MQSKASERVRKEKKVMANRRNPPVQLDFQSDNVVDVLQHISHGGVRSVCHTGQRERVPLAHLDQP